MVTLNGRLSVTHNGHNTWKLYISNVEAKDSGTYMCQINTDPMMSQMGHLSVVIPPDITDDAGSEAGAPEGGSVELRCTAKGVPEPVISWKRSGGRNIVFRDDNGKELSVVESYVGSTLVLKGLQRSDMGTYLCIAANGIPPTKSRRYDVAVFFEPVVRVGSPVILRSSDMQVTLQCYVEASPKSLNTWQKGKSQAGAKLLNSSKYIISEEVINEYALRMNLTINRLRKNDFGDYTCFAINGYGKAEGIITLKETPQKTTTTSTTTITTTTTMKPTTVSTTRLPKRQPKKHVDRGNQNSIDANSRETEFNNALNFYNMDTYGSTPNSNHNEYAQRSERQKVRPSGPPRHIVLYNNGIHLYNVSLFVIILVIEMIV